MTMQEAPIKALLLDIGGVLLNNGWDLRMRHRACEFFKLDFEEVDERHHLTFDAYEEGKLTLYEYLHRVIFYERRPFTREQFREYMFAQSRPHPDMIDFVRELKRQYGVKIGVISNEGRELSVYRIHKFNLSEFVDYFVCSSFVHMRKPDPDIYRLALDIGQVAPEEAAYIEDRLMFVEVAQSLGIHGIFHSSPDSTREILAKLGLALEFELLESGT